MTYENEIINGYIDDISNLYREFFDEVKRNLEKYGTEGISVLRNNDPFRCYLLKGTAINKTCSVVFINTVRVTKTDYYTSFEGHVIVENGERCDKWFNLDAMHMEDVLTLCGRMNFN